MGEQTTLTKAASNTSSLRTTIPSSIVKQFGLEEGDCLDWSLEAEEKAKLTIKVIPLKKHEP